jgi:hypothetical protein
MYCTITTKHRKSVVPMARVRPMASIEVNLNNRTKLPGTFVFFTEKLVDQDWTLCFAERARTIKCTRTIQPAIKGFENYMNDLVIHFNRVNAKNHKAKINGRVSIRSSLLLYASQETNCSAIVVCLDAESSINNLRFTLNIAKKSQGAHLFRMRCFELTTGNCFVSCVFGLDNGHTNEQIVINNLPISLQTKPWQHVSNELHQLPSKFGWDYVQSFTYGDTIIVQEYSTFNNADFIIQSLPLQHNVIIPKQIETLKRTREEPEITQTPVINEHVNSKKVKLLDDHAESEDVSVELLLSDDLPCYSLLN